MKTMFCSLHLFRLHLIPNSYYCRVFHQFGFLCPGFLQMVVILTPLVFPDRIEIDSIFFFKTKGFYGWLSPRHHWFSLLRLNSTKRFLQMETNIVPLVFPLIYISTIIYVLCASPNGLPQSRVGENCCEVVSTS